MAELTGADTFITEANDALERDAYHNVRRNADGEIEMFDADGSTVITFSSTVAIYDLVGVSMLVSQLWQESFDAGERAALKQFRHRVDALKTEHGNRLTAAHIDADLKEREDWITFFDKERDEEEAAHAAAEQERASKG